ncbi:MAG TPA: HEAT repeat domain-containing protein [Gemmatimonadaceae bacterium]|nr:HEAT repeat domain-containing protein [Gemmatimonadaceae bacterium]
MSKVAFVLVAAAAAFWTSAEPSRIVPEVAPLPTFAEVPPPSMFPRDPADSLYRVAREALTGGEYSRAAELFKRITDEYPRSEYAGDAMYWRAFALYRNARGPDLETALRVLREQERRYPNAATRRDARELAVRINGERARRGDPSAAESTIAIAKSGAVRQDSCPDADDENDVRAAALNALLNMDAEQALPILRQVLSRHDACFNSMRRKAVFLVAQKNSPEAAELLLSVIRSDPVPDIRREAVFWMSQIRGDETVTVLDSILRNTDDSEMRDRAIFALSQHNSERSREILRGYVSRPGVSAETQKQVIFALGHYSGHEDNAGFLRELYPRVQDAELKQVIIQSVAQIKGEENARWLVSLARNEREDMEVRKQALFWMGQSGAALEPIIELYTTLGDQELKEHLIFVLSQRNERAATDKLISIARTETNRELRAKAIFWLGQKRDPRVQQLLMEIINQ